MFILKNFKYLKIAKIKSPNYAVRYLTGQTSSSSRESIVENQSLNVELIDGYGQPTYETHPHLVNEGEIAVGMKLEEFKERRMRLMHAIQKYSKDTAKKESKVNHLVLVPSANKKYMSESIPYVLRQNSDFYYLTGCLEPNTILMMTINEKSEMKSSLFIRPKDEHSEMWDGPRTGVERAIDYFGMDEAFSPDKFCSTVIKHVKEMKPVIWFETKSPEQPTVKEHVQNIAKSNSLQISSPSSFIETLRLFKSKSEQRLMRKTCQIASDAINNVIKDTRPGLSEHHIFAMIDYYTRMRNASYLAYPPVVASGANTTTIHYISNSQIVKSGDMVLLDAGCEYGGYTSDITRTWPANGVFTEAQTVLYEVVSCLQKELINLLFKEGGDTLDNLFKTMCVRLAQYLQEVGLADKSITNTDTLCEIGYSFCPHHVSHYLGMDVHDTPLMPRSIKLLPGMVFTIEPGLYISHKNLKVPKEFRGIGIRIEDDILITDNREVEILTRTCIKEKSDLENIHKAKR